jgi:para-nitrobenzyl esterase
VKEDVLESHHLVKATELRRDFMSLRSAIFTAFLTSTLLLGFSPLVAHADGENPVVKLSSGQIRGRSMQGGGAVFKGVPFAQPPLGDLRWRDPQPVKPWTGIRDTGAFGPACTQRIASFNKEEAQGNQEDCLYLNVWTSEWPAKTRKPVMVWLYGGGNTAGAASVGYMDGASLSRRGVIMVTINYRLGIFGFFAHPGLSAESSHHTSGNYGLLDQLAALKWVRDNISQFGGDPDRVTLFGQSAGAIDTSYLVASPLMKGLIHRSIQESGPPIRPTDTLAEAEAAGVKFAGSLKAPADAAEAIKFLRALSGPELDKLTMSLGSAGGTLVRPIIDGYLIREYSALTYQKGQELPIPMIVGGNAREEARGYSRADMVRVIKDNFGTLEPKAMAFYGLDKSELGNEDPLNGTASTQITADTRHRCGAEAESIWRSAHGRATYQFQFDPPVAGETGTRHQAEIPFVFGTLPTTGFLSGPYTDADRKISDQIQTYWTNFAKTGDPNLPSLNGLPEWPKSNPAARPYLEFTEHDGPVVREGLRRDICDLYIEALKQTIPAGTAAER